MAISSVAIIPDGTRRWSKREHVDLAFGYKYAFENLIGQIDVLAQRKVNIIHLYLFSIYNLKRTEKEIELCLNAESVFIEKLLGRKYKICICGDIEKIAKINASISDVIKKVYDNRTSYEMPLIYLYIGYSFKNHLEEILRDEKSVSSVIETLLKQKVDIVIRTGNAFTLSDFLPIESRYSQIYFLPALFNDFSANDLVKLCDQYDYECLKLKYGE